MSVTILEVLKNADMNLHSEGNRLGVIFARSQLHNATILLKKGYGIWDDFDTVMDGHDTVEEVPDWTPPASQKSK